MSRTFRTFAIGACLVVGGVLPAGASAIPPVGECPRSHSTEVTREESIPIDGGVLFDLVNKNGDNIVCFRAHQFRPGGTVIDNHARHRFLTSPN